MKRIWIVALTLLLCVGCLTSCDSVMREIGKTVSVQALDALQPELEGAGFDEFKRYGMGDIAVFTVELNQKGVVLTDEITGVIECYYEHPETGNWVYQLAIGVCAIEDGQTLVEYYRTVYETELAEGRAEIIGDGGWLISVSVSSQPLDE